MKAVGQKNSSIIWIVEKKKKIRKALTAFRLGDKEIEMDLRELAKVIGRIQL